MCVVCLVPLEQTEDELVLIPLWCIHTHVPSSRVSEGDVELSATGGTGSSVALASGCVR